MKLPLHRSKLGRLSALALVGLIVLSACGGTTSQPPEIKITAPESGAALSVGQSVAIVGTATGDAISRVDVIIDGQTYATLNAPDKTKGVPSFPINVPWTPLSAGTHAIQMKAYGPPDDTLLTQSEPLVLNAQAASVPATPTAEAQATSEAVSTAVPAATAEAGNAQTVPTVAPPAGNNAQPAATTAPAAGNANNSAPSLTVTNDFVNVRTGPDTAYDKVGELQQNQTAPVKGKSADGKWWQISFPAGQGGVGWVISDYVQANAAANNVPVASAPPKPVVAVATAAPVAQAPAAQPVLVPLVTVAPPQVAAPAAAPGPLTGGANVLKVEANPVGAGGTAFAYWNIANFKEGCFDRGDGAGCKGPIAQTMRVDVPGVNGARTITLKWTDTNGAAQQDTIGLNISGAPVAAVAGSLSGAANVLRLEANPVPAGTTAYAFWNIPNFKEGCFDKADGGGCKGPIAQAMRVDVPNVTGSRTLTLKWTDTNGAAQQDTLTVSSGGGAVAVAPVVNAVCDANNPDWQAKTGNPQDWKFCKRRDLEWVGTAPALNIDRNDTSYTMGWDVYGVKGVYLVFEPNSSQGPAGSTQLSIPTTGTGPQSFKASDLASGCYRITLRIDTNAGNRTDFGEKILCIGTGGSSQPSPTSAPSTGGGGSSGGGGGGTTPIP